MKSIKHYITDAIKNIEDDREITKELLNDVIGYLSKDETRHREVGLTAAKYVETLQRSNEQLVKVVTLMQKRETGQTGLTEQDKEELFDLIKEGPSK